MVTATPDSTVWFPLHTVVQFLDVTRLHLVTPVPDSGYVHCCLYALLLTVLLTTALLYTFLCCCDSCCTGCYVSCHLRLHTRSPPAFTTLLPCTPFICYRTYRLRRCYTTHGCGWLPYALRLCDTPQLPRLRWWFRRPHLPYSDPIADAPYHYDLLPLHLPDYLVTISHNPIDICCWTFYCCLNY